MIGITEVEIGKDIINERIGTRHLNYIGTQEGIVHNILLFNVLDENHNLHKSTIGVKEKEILNVLL